MSIIIAMLARFAKRLKQEIISKKQELLLNTDYVIKIHRKWKINVNIYTNKTGQLEGTCA
jgi:hypothetical protein